MEFGHYLVREFQRYLMFEKLKFSDCPGYKMLFLSVPQFGKPDSRPDFSYFSTFC